MSEVINDTGKALFEALQRHIARPANEEFKATTEEIIRAWSTLSGVRLDATSAPYNFQLVAACIYSAKANNALLSPASQNALAAIGDEAVNKWYSHIAYVAMPNAILLNGVREHYVE